MRKFLLTLAIALMTVMNVNAQTGYEDTDHEVAISFGGASNSQKIDFYEKIPTIIVGAQYKDDKHTGPISVEYFYHSNKWLGLGGIACYGESSQNIYIGNKIDGRWKNNYLTLMPAIKLNYLRKKNFGMYSKLGVGVTLRFENIDWGEEQNNKDTYTLFNWQASLLGIEVGNPYFRGFAELGIGEQGIACIGVRYKF